MSTTRGIFESFPEPPASRPDSPFAIVNEPASPASPFSAPPRQDSPFAIVADDENSKPLEPGKPARLPERRKIDSPFQMAEPQEGFGFEAPQAFAAAPFEAAPAASSPFSLASPQAAPAPFAMEPAKTPAPVSTPAAFANWQPAVSTPAPAAAPVFQSPPPVEAPAPVVTPAAAAPAVADNQSDSFSIRQLELRAIFGVDREMNPEEILQRSRALPGIRNIARVGQADIASVDALKNLLGNLGFGGGTLKLYSGSVPLDFIREGSVLLAVQTDGGFAPGVRETLMIVARELGRMA